MRRRSIATALVVLATGLTAAALRRRVGRLRTEATAPIASRPIPMPIPAAAPAGIRATAAAPAVVAQAVVMPFAPRATSVPAAQPATEPVRCGDTGGRTKAGAPCAARGTSGGRCHHHRVAV